jgi:hypothetical protein
MRSIRLVLFLFAAVLAHAENSEKFWRVLYSNDAVLLDDAGKPLKGDALKERLEILREVYGDELFTIDFMAPPPKKPQKVEGIVIHADPTARTGDEAWIIGDRNPLVEFRDIRKKAKRDFGIIDLDEKYDGYRFFKKILPKHAAPEMRLGSSFTRKYATDTGLSPPEAIEIRVDEALRKYDQDPSKVKDLRRRAIRVETMRERVNARLGTSFVKVRDLNHSEGKLPKSNKDWIDLYVNYHLNVKDKVLAAEEKADNDGLSLPELLVEIEGVEGRVLDILLDEPSNIIAQKKEDLHREVRTHLAEGKLLENATFLRFYELNAYLPDHERDAINLFMKEVVMGAMNKLGPPYDKFSMTPDIVILKKPGLEKALQEAKEGNLRALFPFIHILDENVDQQSGYLYAEEDRHTAGELFFGYTGKRSRFQQRMEAWKRLPMGKEKVAALKAIRERYKPLEKGDVKEAFWDRVIGHYKENLKQKPTAEAFHQALTELRESGLAEETIYLQFVTEVQDTHPKLRLSPTQAKEWVDYFNTIEPEIETYLDEEGRFRDREITAPDKCKPLKTVGAKNH